MTAQILDGKATAAAIKDELKVRVAKLAEQGVVPGLGTILVGDDPGSRAYVAGKHRDCAAVGISSTTGSTRERCGRGIASVRSSAITAAPIETSRASVKPCDVGSLTEPRRSTWWASTTLTTADDSDVPTERI